MRVGDRGAPSVDIVTVSETAAGGIGEGGQETILERG